ncbi:tetratricopeptide repeat protein [Myxococcus sp. 1LA]
MHGTTPAVPCPDEAQLQDLVQGLLERDELALLEGHLDACVTCRKMVALLAGNEQVDAPEMPSEERLTPGSKVGRYVIQEHLGLGGMGVVFAAHDPELDRKVALKLLRGDLRSGEGRDEAKALLSREAQALARLSHPNVVTVHDVGEHRGGVFIAMDFVSGTTLRRWSRAEPRDWKEVLSCCLQAGWGLAAAHARGLVHRDFKPENVLVGTDGRVRVTDFGLARLTQELEPPLTATEVGRTEARARRMSLHGALVGTLPYMSPEQLDGHTADARSDQFSFCVTLFEALYGQRPFPGGTPEELRRAIRNHAAPSPAGSRVPARIRRLLLKGLAPTPEARHPSMEVLLSKLSRKSRWERWRWVSAGIGVATALGVLSGFWLRESTRCAGLEQRLAGTWDAQRKSRLEAVFMGSGLRWAAQTWHLTAKQLDDYAAALLAMERDACEATYLRGGQSEQMLDLRSACLSRRWSALNAAVDLMLRADPAVLSWATESANALPDIQPCADGASLASVVPLPRSPVQRQRLSVLQVRLAEATALHEAGQQEKARTLAREVLEGVRELGYRPDEAATQLLLGFIEEARGHYDASSAAFRASQCAALAGRDDNLLLRATTGLIGVELDGKLRYEEAVYAASMADAALERMEAMLTTDAAGELYLARGDLRARKNAHDAALLEYRVALVARKSALGETHPKLAEPLMRIGSVLNRKGLHEQALKNHEEALRLLSLSHGPEHPRLIEALDNLGTTLRLMGRVEAAVARYTQALALSEQFGRGDHPTTLMVRVNLGDALQRQGRPHDALTHYARALPGLKQVHGNAHSRVDEVLTRMGDAHANLGQWAPAEQSYAEALELRRKALGREHPEVVASLAAMGEVTRRMRGAPAALEFLEEAVALSRQGEVTPLARGNAQFALAQALWDGTADRPRALALAHEAQESFNRERQGTERERRELEVWLAHRQPRP